MRAMTRTWQGGIAAGRGGAVVAVVLALGLSLAPDSRAAILDTAAVREAAASVLADPGYQRDLPGPPAPSAKGAPAVRPPSLPDARPPPAFGTIRPMSPLLEQAIIWALIAIACGIALAVIVRLIRGYRWRPRAPGQPTISDSAPPGGRPVAGLAEADARAAAGDLAGAVRILLLAAIEVLGHRFGAATVPSLTAREVLRQMAVPEAPRQNLGVLVAAEESSRFAEQPPDVAAWQACRGRFLVLIGALEGATGEVMGEVSP